MSQVKTISLKNAPSLKTRTGKTKINRVVRDTWKYGSQVRGWVKVNGLEYEVYRHKNASVWQLVG